MDIREAIANPTPVADIEEPGEIVSMRTANTKTFSRRDGQRDMRIYGRPIHKRGLDGLFYGLDLAPRRKAVSAPLQRLSHKTEAVEYTAHFDPVRPWNYRMYAGDSWVEYEALFDESSVLSIKVEIINIGVKETITLKDETAPITLSWRVTRSLTGTDVITPPPTAVDAVGTPIPISVTETNGVVIYDVDTTGAAFPVMVDPTSVVATADGSIYGLSNVSYLTARNANSGVLYQHMVVGQYIISDTDFVVVNRSFMTYAIPSMSAISACSLFCHGQSANVDIAFNVNVYESDYTSPLAVSDYTNFDGWQSSGTYNGTILNNTWASSNYTDEDWNEIVLNATGKNLVLAKSGGSLGLAMVSTRDVSANAPNVRSYVQFSSHTTAGETPYLSITFTALGPSIPAVMSTYRQRRV